MTKVIKRKNQQPKVATEQAAIFSTTSSIDYYSVDLTIEVLKGLARSETSTFC
jgi:hypothetical protein